MRYKILLFLIRYSPSWLWKLAIRASCVSFKSIRIYIPGENIPCKFYECTKQYKSHEYVEGSFVLNNMTVIYKSGGRVKIRPIFYSHPIKPVMTFTGVNCYVMVSFTIITKPMVTPSELLFWSLTMFGLIFYAAIEYVL